MTAVSFKTRVAILDEVIASGQFGDVARDRVYKPRSVEQPVQVVLLRRRTGTIFVMNLNADGSLTRGRDRYVSDTGDEPASDGA